MNHAMAEERYSSPFEFQLLYIATIFTPPKSIFNTSRSAGADRNFLKELEATAFSLSFPKLYT